MLATARELVAPFPAEWEGIWQVLEARRRPDGTILPWPAPTIRSLMEARHRANRDSGRLMDQSHAVLLWPSLAVVKLLGRWLLAVGGAAGLLLRQPKCPHLPGVAGIAAKDSGHPAGSCPGSGSARIRGQIEVAFIHGTVASGRETAASDVDLCLVGEASLRDVASALRGAEDLLGREVNPSLYPPEEFKRRLRERSPFLTRITSGPKHFVVGSQGDLVRLVGQPLAGRAPADTRGSARPARGG
jgi:hypothetical protein